ncbi:uncharacterized protein LOC126895196, partial [Daktulosphaira vitifoliae]|uniref:uncharacterized protein LOC126895196 n=1 Tax=Daktulosphaira vitifoliae TaxID=58002 RepID=UPI0021AAAD01
FRGKFDTFVGSRRKSNSNSKSNTTVVTDSDGNVESESSLIVKLDDTDVTNLNSIFKEEIKKPPVILADIDLTALYNNLTKIQHLEDVIGNDRTNLDKMIQTHGKLLASNINSNN